MKPFLDKASPKDILAIVRESQRTNTLADEMSSGLTRTTESTTTSIEPSETPL
jgi:hypothetical protein